MIISTALSLSLLAAAFGEPAAGAETSVPADTAAPAAAETPAETALSTGSAAPVTPEDPEEDGVPASLADIEPRQNDAPDGREPRAKTERTVSAWLLGGRSFASDSRAWTGNADFLAASIFRPGERWEFLPLYKGYYQLTRQSFESAGGPVLIQHRMDHRIAAKLIYDPPGSRQRFKFSAGGTAVFLKEARDEHFGKGLFDYRMPEAGIEWEYFYRKGYSFRAGYDYYPINFPNYISLAGQGPNPEVLELRGARVLNSRSHAFTAGINGPLERLGGMWDVSYRLTFKQYPDQPLVEPTGQLSGSRRRDVIHSLGFSSRMEGNFRWPPTLIGGLEAVGLWFGSNQDHFDVYENKFLPGYYSYGEFRLGPYATAYFGGSGGAVPPVRLSLSLEWSSRFYADRPIQDASGGYGASRLLKRSLALDATLTWPLSKRLSARSTYRLYADRSNMKYEGFYRYTYSQQELLAGIGYEF